jgi:nitroreductase
MSTVCSVDEAILSRRSVRAFRPDPVPNTLIEEILALASHAPSGTNTQPWKVTVLTGEPLRTMSKKIIDAYQAPDYAEKNKPEYAYYPSAWVSPYIDRRRKVGWDMYSLLGIPKTDKEAMKAQSGRNFTFFDAPVGLIFSIDRVMAQGSWLDYGMFLQTLMLAARGRGLDTCAQAAFIDFHQIIGEFLNWPESEMLVCGMALGYADTTATVNALTTSREPVSGFTRFLGD